MGDLVAVLESQFVGLATMRSELDDLKKVAVLITTLAASNEYEPLITTTSILKE